MEIEVIEIDLIQKSKELIAQLDNRLKEYIRKVNIALKDGNTVTYAFTLQNDTTFDITIKRDDLDMLEIATSMCVELLKKMIDTNEYNSRNSNLSDTKKVLDEMDLN